MLRALMLVLALGLVAACDPRNDLTDPPAPLGDFQLGLNIVVPETAQTVPITRPVTPEEWKTTLTKAIDDRFGRYEGGKLYNFGVSVDGYSIAPPGVPLVASPKSVLIITFNIWDDAAQKQLNPGGKQITLVEGVSPETVFGSGWTQSKRQQLDKMAYKAAYAIQNYLLENPEWFGLPAKGAEAAAPDAPALPAPPAIPPRKRPSGQIP